jgi:hypothetical protein
MHGIIPDGGASIGGSSVPQVIIPTPDAIIASGVTISGQALRIQTAIVSGGCIVNGVANEGFLYEIDISGGITVGGDSIDAISLVGQGGSLVNGEGSELHLVLPAIGSNGVKLGGVSFAPAIIEGSMNGGVSTGGEAPSLSFIPMYGGAIIGGEAVETFLGAKYLRVPNQAAHGLHNSTFVFWVKTDSTDEQAIMSGANSGKDNEILIKFQNGQISFINHTNEN